MYSAYGKSYLLERIMGIDMEMIKAALLDLGLPGIIIYIVVWCIKNGYLYVNIQIGKKNGSN